MGKLGAYEKNGGMAAHKTRTPSQAELDPRGRCCGMPSELRGVAEVPLGQLHPASPFPPTVLILAERVSPKPSGPGDDVGPRGNENGEGL